MVTGIAVIITYVYSTRNHSVPETQVITQPFGSHLSTGLLRGDGQLFSSLGRNGRSDQIMRRTVWSNRPLFDNHSIGSNHEINQQKAAAVL